MTPEQFNGIYFAAQPLAVQHAMLRFNPDRRRLAMLYLAGLKGVGGAGKSKGKAAAGGDDSASLASRLTLDAPYTIDPEIHTLGHAAWDVMSQRYGYGYTKWFAEGEKSPWGQEPIECTPPGVYIPDVPSYADFVAANPDRLKIKVSLDPADYPANPFPFRLMTAPEFQALRTKLAALVYAGYADMAPLNREREILLPDSTDDVDVPVDGDGFPLLDHYNLRPGQQQRFGLVMNIEGGPGVRAYWAQDIADAISAAGGGGDAATVATAVSNIRALANGSKYPWEESA